MNQISLFSLIDTKPIESIESKDIKQSSDINMKDIISLINKRRRQILIHSCVYYRMGTSLISDTTYDKWAKELQELQEKYPDIALNHCIFAESFNDFTYETGFDLPLEDPWVTSMAQFLVIYENEGPRNGTISK